MKKNLFGSVAVLLALGSSFALAASSAAGNDLAPGMSPGGIQRKYVGLLFDVMGTAPANVLANADRFAEHAPYLDGVAICLNAVPVVDENGNTVTSQLSRIMHRSERWTRDALRHHVPVLKAIASKPHLKESFLLFWMTPQTRADRLAWTDDKAWANYAENMATVAWLAKEGGLKGLMLDPEEYANAPQYVHTSDDPPFRECARIARQRGREVFSRVFKEYPDAVLFTLWYFAKFRPWMEEGRQTHPAVAADDSGELLQYFYNGMLDVMPPAVRVVDGCEHYSLSATRSQYLINAVTQSTGALAFIAPENQVKYRSQVLYSNTHYLDMYRTNANSKSLWYHGPVNGSRLEHLRLNLEQSFFTATEYVWIYGEGSGKLFDWRGGHYDKKQTWEELAPGMTETIMLVKDPERWAAMRRAKLKAEGKLVNLVAGAKPVRLENPVCIRQYSEPEEKMPSVKGVKPGERYLVSVMVQTSFGHRGKGRRDAACPRVIWRKNGKRLDVSAAQIDVPKEACSALVKTEGVVTVPDGADELLFDLAAELHADERVHYRHPTICNAFDPVDVEKAVPASKWTLDLKKRTLSNGHWKLSAGMRNGRLFVSGDGKKTVGGGVLDLRNVKADTGYDIFEINRFAGFEGITGLVAPDVPSIPTRAFQHCNNMKVAILGDLPVGKRAVTANERRRDRLGRLAICKELADIRKRVGYWHNPVVRKGFGSEIAVKGVKPGELYNLAVSMKRSGAGVVFIKARFVSDGRTVGRMKNLAMSQQREDGVWRSGETVARVPDGADMICFDVFVELSEGENTLEFDNFQIYKIGDPLPVWPAEALREKWR